MATTNHEISLQEAIDMTTLYRANRPSDFPICETFETAAINQLLATEGCSYLRIYYGMKEDFSVHAILIAVDADGEDILPPGTALNEANDTDIVILEDGYRCPPDCPPKSLLNDSSQ